MPEARAAFTLAAAWGAATGPEGAAVAEPGHLRRPAPLAPRR